MKTDEFLAELLRPILKDAVKEALKGYQPDMDLMTVDEAAIFLSMGKDYIYRKTSNGEIPFFKKGKRCYFSRKDLTKWIKGE
jgi:excisionase family DNA binding protein